MGIAHRTFILSLLLVTSAVAQEWQNKGTGLPGQRTGHTLVWDPVNGQLILFGGKTSPSTPTNDVFLWDPATSTWSEPPGGGASLPTARAYAQAVWDTALNRMAIHGGENEFGSALSAARAYTPSTGWTTLPISIPLKGHASVYDPGTNKMLVFGGTSGGGPSSLSFKFEITDTGSIYSISTMPTALMFHSAVINAPTNGKVYVFGGTNGTTYSNAIYVYNTTENLWTTLSAPGGPAPRAYHSAVWDTTRSRMYVYGGKNNSTAFSDLWAFDPATSSWEELTANSGPGARISASAAWVPEEDAFYLYGGESAVGGTMAPGELWKYVVSGNGGGGNNNNNRSGGASREGSEGLCGVSSVHAAGMTLLATILMGVLLAMSCRR